MSLYLARDADGGLRLHPALPERNRDLGLWETGEEATELPRAAFPGLRWDGEPLPVALRPLAALPPEPEPEAGLLSSRAKGRCPAARALRLPARKALPSPSSPSSPSSAARPLPPVPASPFPSTPERT
ncbi:hypothetical protein dsx2_3396 [Desulfovibrio sp. X2]|uniref:hypothetical protein n=1 Tax=Desulfovibrio sp. X2 TaxID=941449 RepID=UPI00035871D7|nr:hypothetical protein [Desulfovibrio sp. X2]EPR39658.1 hypothetical protein dsx2_3396 [Desulfovibrio sp. X2]